MFNSQKPTENDLPSSTQLIKSTIIAILIAFLLLICVVLPAEYGYDPTGVGDLLSLKKMGEIKTSLKQEELNDSQLIEESLITQDSADLVEEVTDENTDQVEVVIEPGNAIEIKLEMKKDAVAHYDWIAINGILNFNLHGDGYKGMHQSTTYKKGRSVHSDKGELKAEFDGYHGWFWRNRNDVSVTVKLEATGDFIQMKQMK
jgi:hypothetical protein